MTSGRGGRPHISHDHRPSSENKNPGRGRPTTIWIGVFSAAAAGIATMRGAIRGGGMAPYRKKYGTYNARCRWPIQPRRRREVLSRCITCSTVLRQSNQFLGGQCSSFTFEAPTSRLWKGHAEIFPCLIATENFTFALLFAQRTPLYSSLPESIRPLNTSASFP